MKTIILCIIVLFAATSTISAQNYTNGYTKKNGTYVMPHYKTSRNNTNLDNYSTTPNTNVYTGKRGSRARDYSPEANRYGTGRTIETGSSGGQYYRNDKGNKVYVPKQ